MSATDRKYPMKKPDGHVPPIPRFTARMTNDAPVITIVYMGAQSKSGDEVECLARLAEIDFLMAAESGADHRDYAKFTDTQGYLTMFAVGYWRSPDVYDDWVATEQVSDWWFDPGKDSGDIGYFRESMIVPSDYAETNIFKEYVRGLSACPMSKIEPIDETGYWGAARDRFPASAYDQFEVPDTVKLDLMSGRNANQVRVKISPHQNFVVIRSGVTWQDCGDEQLQSFENNIKPKLDIGMTYLREHPLDTGCCSLRQVDVIDVNGSVAMEEFSLGYFRSLADLEAWAHEHPTHLAIFTRAIAEREKYGEKLELRTYHEIYVLTAEGSQFEYVNCHGNTGLLPFYDGE